MINCTCTHFTDTGSYRVLDMACPLHGLGNEDMRARVLDALNEVYKPEGCALWYESPNRMLDGRTPRQAVDAGDGGKVLDVIDLLVSGGYA